jgi:hypothetical protein
MIFIFKKLQVEIKLLIEGNKYVPKLILQKKFRQKRAQNVF